MTLLLFLFCFGTRMQGSLVVLFHGGRVVCIVDGVSLAMVVQENVMRINEGKEGCTLELE